MRAASKPGLRDSLLAAVIALLAALVLAPAASAAPPPNDNFANAQALAGPLPLKATGTNVEATRQTAEGEPDHFFGLASANKSVWYSWTASGGGEVIVDTCESFYTSTTSIYTGSSVGALTAVGMNLDRCRVLFLAAAGTTYRIAIDGRSAFLTDPDGQINLELRSYVPPANDDFADAQTVSGALPIVTPGSTVDASAELVEPPHGGSTFPLSSIWYRWTATVTGEVVFDTCIGDVDTLMSVYTGTSFANLTEVGTADDGCFRQSKIAMQVTTGTEYWIAIDGVPATSAPDQGPVNLRIRLPGGPPNDDFADAEVLGPAFPLTANGDSTDATYETGEPNHITTNTGGASVWYSWTPTANAAVSVDTCESDFQARLAIYTGTAVNALSGTQVGAAYGSANCGLGRGRINLNAVGGTTYRIVVDGAFADQGQVVLRIRPRPANDDFADAEPLSGALPIQRSASTVNASDQVGEPDHATGGNASLWYRWTAPSTARYVVDVCASGIEAAAGVYTGNTINPAPTAVQSFRSNCKRLFQANSGQEYKIAVEGRDGEQGPVDLVLRAISPPVNDNLANAVVLPASLPQTVNGTGNVDATDESGEPTHVTGTIRASLWYDWTPSTSGPVTIENCGNAAMRVAVYTGAAFGGGFAAVGTRSTNCNVRLAAVAGTTYHVAVDTAGVEVSSFELDLRPTASPPNDDFADAKALSQSLPVSIDDGTNVDATKEPSEPNHNGNAGSSSVWHSWIAPANESVTIEVCVVPASFFGMVDVYTGTALGNLVSVGVRKSRCRKRIDAVAGTKYWIAVDGFSASGSGSGSEGTFQLGIHANSPPANDNYANAQVVGASLPATATGSNVDATAESGEPAHATLTATSTVWYSWTPGADASVIVEGCASETDGATFGPPTGVYLGSAVNNLVEQGARKSRCRVALAAQAGQQYRIVIGPIGLAEGPVQLDIRTPSPPANDHFANAEVLSGALPIEVGDSTLDASRENDEPNHATGTGIASVWYSWTPAVDASVEVDACATGVTNTLLGVYTGAALGAALMPAGSRDPIGTLGRSCRATLEAVAGTPYKIAVDRTNGREGPFSLRIGPPGPPAAPVLTGTSPSSGSNNNSPRVLGTASGDTVTLYQSANCSGPVEKTGTPAELLSPGLQASVADNTTSQFSAKASNGEGTSPCSNAITYVEDSTVVEPPPKKEDPPGGTPPGSTPSGSAPSGSTPSTPPGSAPPSGLSKSLPGKKKLKCKKGFKKVKVKGKQKCKKVKKKKRKRR